MQQTTLWWLIAGAAVALELVTGTFYLLMLAVGFAAAALAAYAGAGLTTQLVVAGIVGGGSVVSWYFVRKRRGGKNLPASANPNVNQDIGAAVYVDTWRADGTGSTSYRGAQWTVALHDPSAQTSVGTYRVVEVVGNRLLVDKV
ncbi:NfeD family protein [Variovorax sp. HJSM1_2]|uniref:NfeD family protein n=1 Tax=Variovorax sp. HJSM1_2 TaxID=3366263 RepID=UPI003BC5B4F5